MNITLLTVGRPAEAWVRAAVDAYRQRLRYYADIVLTDVKAEPRRRSTSEGQVRSAEAERLRKAMPEGAFTIVLTPDGESTSSEHLAERIGALGLRGRSRITLIVGGAYGLDPDLSVGADWRLSLSSLTFSHDLALVVLMEQLYRAFTILRGESYHK